MAENKTKPTALSPAAFIKQQSSEQRRKDCQELASLMRDITGHPPKMWGASIVGFDRYHYKYASGREGEMLLTGFSPRKQDLVLYLGSSARGHEAAAQARQAQGGKRLPLSQDPRRGRPGRSPGPGRAFGRGNAPPLSQRLTP